MVKVIKEFAGVLGREDGKKIKSSSWGSCHVDVLWSAWCMSFPSQMPWWHWTWVQL